MKILDLNWPKNIRMDLLAEVLDEEMLERLIFCFCDKSEAERKIRLPKRSTILKCVAFYYGQQVLQKKTTWKKVMENLKAEFGLLKNANVTQKKFKQYYQQRFNEIMSEKNEKV